MKLQGKKKILLVGSDFNAPGGIATVNRTILKSKKISGNYEIEFLPTWDNKNWVKKYIKALISIKSKIKKVDLVHFSLAAYGSCYRKIIISKLINDIPYIIHLHTGRFATFYFSQNEIMKKQINKFFNKAKLIICVSEYCKNEIIKLLNLDKNKVVRIYNGINLIEDQNDNISIKDNHIRKVLFMGSYINNRCIKDYLEMSNKYKENSNIHFYIAGDGKVDKLENYNVIDVSYIDEKKKNEFLNQIDVLINGFYYESFGISMIECMNRKVCIIGRKSCAIPEILGYGEYGLLFQKYDDVQNILDELLINNDKLKYYKEKAYARSLDFPIEQFEENLLMKYREILKENGKEK